MTEFIRDQAKPEVMLKASDVAEAVRVVLRWSPNCVAAEIAFQRPGHTL